MFWVWLNTQDVKMTTKVHCGHAHHGSVMCESLHDKTHLKVFVVVITKRKIGRQGPANPSFSMTTSET